MKILKLTKCTIAILPFVALCSCTNNASKTKDASARFPLGTIEIQALGGGACAAPCYIAKEKGFYEAEGLDVTLVAGTFETNKTGLASGKFPVAMGDFQFFPSANEGLDIKLIAGLHEGCIKLLAPPGSPIKNAKDLDHKRIGVDEIGGTPMAITSVYLANNGIDPIKGVTWLPYPLEQLMGIAERGQLDAIALWDPFATLAVKKGYRVLCDIGTHPLFKGRYCCFLYASGKQLKENPKRIKAILKALEKSSEWITKHPEETAKIMIQKKYVACDDPALIAELIKSYKYHSCHNAGTRHKAKTDALYFTDQLKKTGFLPKTLDTQKFVDNLYFELPVETEKGGETTNNTNMGSMGNMGNSHNGSMGSH
jgi:NitT/TauT family transport system substrate-binding protein